MDIHKPKPFHGWREFLKEYGIIVLGVLTALAFEQLVETLHWADKVRQGEAQARHELTLVYANARERDVVESCLDRQLAALSDALEAGEGRWAPPPPLPTPNLLGVAVWAPSRDWPEETWRTLVADGTATHFGEAKEAAYANIYAQVARVHDQNAVEVSDVENLGVLTRPTVLTRPERNQIVTQIERERIRNHLMSLSSRQLIGKIEKVTTVDQATVAKFLDGSPSRKACVALGLLKPGT